MKSTDILLRRLSRKIDLIIKYGEDNFQDLSEFNPKLQELVNSGLIVSFKISNDDSVLYVPSIEYITPKELGGKIVLVPISGW